MEALIAIIVICVILFIALRKKGTSTHDTTISKETEQQVSPLRDYLEEATSFVGAPVPLSQLLETNRVEVIQNLVNSLNWDAGNMMDPATRKAAAYALGQIGDPSIVSILTRRLSIERASGVKDAIVASISAINLAPEGPSYTQLDRRRIIEDVYKNRRPPQLSSWKSS